MLEIDGSQGEGGGQTVRTAVALSALTGMDFHMTRIRENRPTRGLSKQHCTAIDGVAKMTDSWVKDNFPGSRDITFRPGNSRHGDLKFDVGSAGSISLVMQALLLAARFHTNGIRLDITGGTNVMWAPPVDFYGQVLFPLMKRMGFEAHMEIINRGFYPEGGGRVIVNMRPPLEILPLNVLELGDFKRVEGGCYCR
ncbi:MAG: RNA 3'-terminal phosphate cyclase, partial [Candidatus Methanomethylophilaceae archaeon]